MEYYIYSFLKLFARLRGGRFAGIYFQNLVLEEVNMLPMNICVSEQLSLYGSRGRTTITMSRASKLCARGRSQSQNMFYMESTSLGKPRNVVPWSECQPEFPVNCQHRNESKS